MTHLHIQKELTSCTWRRWQELLVHAGSELELEAKAPEQTEGQTRHLPRPPALSAQKSPFGTLPFGTKKIDGKKPFFRI